MADTLTKKRVEKSKKNKKDNSWHLLLWNDDVNDMIDIIKALYEICNLKEDTAVKVMLEAHQKGQSFAKSGEQKEMTAMQQGLSDRGISASVIKEDIEVS